MTIEQSISNSLKGKVCIITGGAGLLGQHFSKALASAGAVIILSDVDSKKGKKVAEDIRRTTQNDYPIFRECDITDKKEIDTLISEIVKKFGHIDALINNAYPRTKNYGKKFEDVAYEDFCENVCLHLGGYFLITREVAEIMKRQNSGVIVNMASIYGFKAPKFEIYRGTKMTMPVEYSAIKGGIVNLTKYLASYLGQYGIRVNSISPGGILDNQPPGFIKKYSEHVRLGRRMAEPGDIVGALLFLLSDASGYITGQNIVVDGGWTL